MREQTKSKYLCVNCQTHYRVGLSKFCFRCKQTLEKERLKAKRKKEKLKLRKQILRERKKLSPSKMRKDCDELFSKIIRTRDKVCLRCGKNKNLQCAHIIRRTNLGHRWDEKSALCLCYGCHLYWFHKEPVEATSWLMEKLPEYFTYYQAHKNDISPSTVDYVNLKSELETRLKELGE